MTLTKKALGNLIKEARQIKSKEIGKRYSQQMLANDIGKSQSHIGDIESGRTYPSFKILNSISKACGVPISYFEDSDSLNKDIDNFIKIQLTNLNDEEVKNVREAIKNDPDAKLSYIYDYLKTNYNVLNNIFNTPENIVKFMLKHPKIIDFCGINTSELQEDELNEFTNELLSHIKLLSYKYKTL